MYVSLIEVYHQASDIRTRRAHRDHKVLATAELTDKALARMHKRRLKLLAEGRDAQVIRTAVPFDDPRRENPRRKRRIFARAMRRIMKRVRLPTPEQREQMDDELDKMWDQRKPVEKRTKSGLVVPGGRGK